MNTYV